MATILAENFTDPGCPWAFSAEPALLALRWRYGDQIAWVPRMIVLSERPEEVLEKGFTPERQASALAALGERFGMPIDAAQRPRMQAQILPARAVVAARRHAPDHAEALLRRLRVLQMGGAMTDEPAVLDRAAREAGLPPRELRAWMREPETEDELRDDMAAARSPLPAALALDHKLAPAGEGRRYTCPTLVLHPEEGRTLALPGFQPVEAYEALIANADPALERRSAPESVEDLLAWAPWPLATAEIAAVMELEADDARRRLEEAGTCRDGYWTLSAPARSRAGAAQPRGPAADRAPGAR